VGGGGGGGVIFLFTVLLSCDLPLVTTGPLGSAMAKNFDLPDYQFCLTVTPSFSHSP